MNTLDPSILNVGDPLSRCPKWKEHKRDETTLSGLAVFG
jgi:hypothetical protein